MSILNFILQHPAFHQPYSSRTIEDVEYEDLSEPEKSEEGKIKQIEDIEYEEIN